MPLTPLALRILKRHLTRAPAHRTRGLSHAFMHASCFENKSIREGVKGLLYFFLYVIPTSTQKFTICFNNKDVYSGFFYLLPYKKSPPQPQLGYQQRKKKYFNLISQGIDYPNFIVTRRIVIFLRPV